MLDVVKQQSVAKKIPFDADRLDRLMDEAGIDVLLTTSKHNVQYLLGGHRAFFFESMDAMGLSRYLPVLVYPKGSRQKAGYFGHRMEGFQKENDPFWVSESQTNSSGTVDAMQKAIDYARKLGAKPRRIGAELGFLPIDAGGHCQSRPGRDQAGADRSAAARGDQPRPYLRLLPDHGGLEPQPRAVGAEMGQGRRALARFRRQLSRLYRRPLSDGDSRRARCRARRFAGRDRANSARVDEADQGGGDGQRGLRRGRTARAQIQAPQPHALPRPRHGIGQSRSAAAHRNWPGAV